MNMRNGKTELQWLESWYRKSDNYVKKQQEEEKKLKETKSKKKEEK